jgi:hypothetical protein
MLTVLRKALHMGALPTLLLSIPLGNPFPGTLGLSAAAIAAFGVELAIARLRVHPRKWLYVLLLSCVALAAILAVWSGYYARYGPPFVEPRNIRTGVHNPYWDFYKIVSVMHFVMVLLIFQPVFMIGILLRRHNE